MPNYYVRPETFGTILVVQSAVLRLHVVCLSVCDVGRPTVDQDHIGWKSGKLHGQLAQHLRSS